jgi:hypothetical protein
LRLFQDDGYNLLASSQDISVEASAGVKVVASPASAKPGQPISVSFWGGPATSAGVIGMYEMTKADRFYLEMQPLNGRRCGTLTFFPPGPGTYDFRMFEDNVYRKLMGQSNAVRVG